MTAQIIDVEFDSLNELNGTTLSQAIDILKEMHTKHGDSVTLRLDIDWDEYDEYHQPKLSVFGQREENYYEVRDRDYREKVLREDELTQLAYLKDKYEQS